MLTELTEVIPINNNNFVFLDDILSPMWKFLRYNGLLHGLVPQIEELRLLYIIRCLSTALIIVLVLNLGTFEFTQLIIAIQNRKSITEISFNVMMSALCLTAIIFFHQFYTKHSQLVRFFKEFKQLEMLFLYHCNQNKSEKIKKVVKVFFFHSLVSHVILMLYVNYISPEEPIFFSHYGNLHAGPTLFFLELIFAVSSYFTFVAFLLSGIIPPIVFYQAGCMIENLTQDLLYSFTPYLNQPSVQLKNENIYRLIWKKYESIQDLINRANQLFGVVILNFQLTILFLACFHIHQVIIFDDKFSPVYLKLFTFVYMAVIVIVSNLLYSHLYLCCGDLKSAVAGLLSRNWQLLSHEHRSLLMSFLIHLDGADLAGRPLNLYTINPTNLPRVFQLLISYVIVLLQL